MPVATKDHKDMEDIDEAEDARFGMTHMAAGADGVHQRGKKAAVQPDESPYTQRFH
jgi:hypothetical protein